MAKVVVDVMLKPEILDPQGRAVRGALGRLGLEGVRDVRQGKRFEIELDDGAGPDVVDRIRDLSDQLLANPVIEDYQVHLIGESNDHPPAGSAG